LCHSCSGRNTFLVSIYGICALLGHFCLAATQILSLFTLSALFWAVLA